jgi:hypothetical protein
MKQAGETQDKIAQAVGFSLCTISKQLSRNHGERGYRSAQSERHAEERRVADFTDQSAQPNEKNQDFLKAF